ncbi:helix-turn-helix domain-containing protein [Pseudonocardia asaccharolytica]|uniref:Transcriptional regulator n=1 Tax=Pseudonocardia asaccharolytica DSM 44247 = NBRC 16224 TaxID=1123024 RepID=A0A511CW44_9PSEU|nr:helix-turn-helix domain-containing protein [Pseudonocardia asaccharolytica]GEL16790.1 transcriptional regulator [Pseudonocardia asaccharolytica DSM 44247 = NBRC 16224]
MATADLLLHPVRLRILRALLDGRDRTTSDLRGDLPDIAPATLYRHVALLAEAGVLTVVAEQRVRGAVERTYRLPHGSAEVDDDALAAMTPADHRRAFTAFVAGLLADFDRYLDRDDVDPRQDGVGYRQAALWLTDAELDALLAEVRTAVAARLHNPPVPGRVRRLLSTVLMPAGGPPGDDPADGAAG